MSVDSSSKIEGMAPSESLHELQTVVTEDLSSLRKAMATQKNRTAVVMEMLGKEVDDLKHENSSLVARVESLENLVSSLKESGVGQASSAPKLEDWSAAMEERFMAQERARVEACERLAMRLDKMAEAHAAAEERWSVEREGFKRGRSIEIVSANPGAVADVVEGLTRLKGSQTTKEKRSRTPLKKETTKETPSKALSRSRRASEEKMRSSNASRDVAEAVVAHTKGRETMTTIAAKYLDKGAVMKEEVHGFPDKGSPEPMVEKERFEAYLEEGQEDFLTKKEPLRMRSLADLTKENKMNMHEMEKETREEKEKGNDEKEGVLQQQQQQYDDGDEEEEVSVSRFESAGSIFDAIDKNQDGVIDRAELSTYRASHANQRHETVDKAPLQSTAVTAHHWSTFEEVAGSSSAPLKKKASTLSAASSNEKDVHVPQKCDHALVSASAEPNNRVVETKKKAGGRLELVYENGRTEVKFSNGTVKETSPNGDVYIRFSNGDVKHTFASGNVRYFYAEAGAWQTTFKDGSELLEFNNKQVERHYPDGTKEILFADGRVRVSFPDGTEQDFEAGEFDTKTFTLEGQ